MNNQDRLAVVDLGRGVVMAVMALDHTRTFLTNVSYSPTDLTRTYPALFATRWLSHFCTPLFLFLAGVGAFLMTTRKRDRAARFLVTRGLVLIALEMTVVRWGWYFNLDYGHTSLQILWAIGVSMMLLSPLVFLPPRLVGGIGLAIVALHNWVGPTMNALEDGGSWIWALLYQRGHELTVASDVTVMVNFPVLPLFGVMAIGYGFGEVFRQPARDRRRLCVGVGVACLIAFVALRAFTGYGDPLPWSAQSDGIRSLLSFLLLTKHPLSLLMILATLGPALIWLGVIREERPVWWPFIIVGRVPMMFYLVHVPVIHAIALVLSLVFVGDVGWLLTSPFARGAVDRVPAGWGFGLPGVYAWWVVVLAIMFPLCYWFAALKARSRARWLTYF